MKSNIAEYVTEDDKWVEEESRIAYTLLLARITQIKETEGFSEVMNLLLDISNFNGNNYVKEAHEMTYLEGRRSVFHDFLGVLEDCDSTLYPRLLLKRAKELEDGRRK